MRRPSEVIREHWPTRDQEESRAALARVFDYWRFGLGLPYLRQYHHFQRMLGKDVELAEFDNFLRRCDETDGPIRSAWFQSKRSITRPKPTRSSTNANRT